MRDDFNQQIQKSINQATLLEKSTKDQANEFNLQSDAKYQKFKSEIEIEYLEFFKSRQRIKNDWQQYSKETET